jgi:hypothetical protein
MAASSSLGSEIFAILSLLVISTLVLLLLRHYLPLRTTPGYLLVPVFLALALPSSIILLVPIDLASTENADGEGPKRGVWLPERAVFVTWRITYWLTFVLTWFILPLMGEFCDSGFRDTRGRILHSLRSNARYQLIVLSTSIAGLVYFVLQNGFHGESIKGLVMALAYAWGLVLAIGLMGHGLVAMPRRLFKNASLAQKLRRLQTQAPKIKDKLDESYEELEALENIAVQLKSRKSGTSGDTQDWIDELAETSTLADSRPGVTAAVRASSSSIPAVLTERYLADLTRKLKRARHKRARFMDEWASLCQQAQDTQTVIDSAKSRKLEFGRPRSGTTILTPNLRFYLHYYGIPYLRLTLSVIFACASILVVWSEVVSSFSSKLSIIGLTVVHHPDSDRGQVPFFGQLIAAAWLLYMDACALYAISDVKVWGNRALVKRQTYAESACWYSLQVAKLTVPLSFNFITMMPASVYKETSFYHFLGKLVNLTPLGSGFSTYFPCFILIPALATLFNLYGKVKKVIGFGVLEDDDMDNPSGFGTGGWREGRALIERENQSGNEGTTLGMSPRGTSLDLEQGPANAGSSTPARRLQQAPLLPGHANIDPRVGAANRQFNAITNHEEEREDDSARHFYQDFAERVKNTFDTTDRPEWIQNLSNGITMPNWMNDDRDSDGGSALKRWFGGRAEDGRVRL